MKFERLRAAYTAQPFRPFRPFIIRLADGRGVPVLSRELIMAAPSGRMVIVAQPDDSVNMIDVPFISDLTFKTPKSSWKRRKGRH